MLIEADFWQLVTLMISFFGFVFGAGKVLLHQIDKRLDGRFQAMETARAESSKHWETQFSTVIEQNQREADGWKRLEREFLELRADLPLHYVRREDYIRGQTVIEAKLDVLQADRDGFVRREDHVRSETIVHAKLDALARSLKGETA